MSQAQHIQHTLLVTARANFVNGARSWRLQTTEQYMRSISTAIVQLDTYSAGLSADDMDRFRDELNRTLFFFCNLLDGLGLCIAYVMKRARDRNMSAVIQLSIKLLKALVKRCKAYGVKSSPFRASRSFLVTPIWQLVYQLE